MNTMFHEAVFDGKCEVVEFMLQKKTKLRYTHSKTGHSPLYVAAENGHLEVVKCLIKHKADVDKASKRVCTPLYAAAQNGHLDIVE